MPYLSTSGRDLDDDVDGFSLNLLGGRHGSVRGLELGGLFNWQQRSARWVQMAGVFNQVGSVWGVQVAGVFNRAEGAVRGVQVAGGLNRADEVTGAQVGLVNVARRVRGLQLGVVNVARELDGEALGLFSWIGNGYRHFELGVGDARWLQVGGKFGGRHLYSVLVAGLGTPGREAGWSVGLGWGAHVDFGRLALDADVLGSLEQTGWHRPQWDGRLLGEARSVLGWRFSKAFAGFLGPTLQVPLLGPSAARGRYGLGFVAGVRL